MRLVVVESPYAGDTPEEVERNVAYAREAMTDSLLRGEAPFLSHLLYPQVLDDSNPEQREAGIAAGLAWGDRADRRVVYADFGISSGMRSGIERAHGIGQVVEYRKLDGKRPEESAGVSTLAGCVPGCGVLARGCVPGCWNYDPEFDG